MNPQPPADTATRTQVQRILIADDQPFNIEVAGSALGRLGYEIITASDGPTVFRRLQVRRVDLILLDLLMPGMDGCEICRRLRENPDWSDIPVIFLSAADEKELVVRALESGGMDYIAKPFNHAELVSRVRTHLALKTARDQLRQLAEDKDELMGILTHDLKNHLGGMQMSAELLRERLSKGEDRRAAQLAENIHHSGAGLLSFVRAFLANSAADHGFQVRPEPVDLGAAAQAAVRNHRDAAQRKSVDLALDVTDAPVSVLADPSALAQVMDNLLSNAIKFSPSGSRVEVRVRSRADGGVVSVRDEGPGFTETDLQHLFKRYRRLSARPTGGEPSTGLGLSIANKLAVAMGAGLRLESAPGAGSTFHVLLPAVPANAPT